VLSLIRDIHLAVALFCTPFVLAYALDGVRVNHGSIYPKDSRKSEHTYAVSATDADAIAVELDVRHGLKGRYWPPGGDGSFAIAGATATHTVRYDAATRSARVQTERPRFFSLATNLHFASGVHFSHASLNAWGWLVVLVSVAFVALGVTGLWLWIPRLKERRLGLLFLGVSVGYCALCLAWIRLA
jgi:hypothetical protein